MAGRAGAAGRNPYAVPGAAQAEVWGQVNEAAFASVAAEGYGSGEEGEGGELPRAAARGHGEPERTRAGVHRQRGHAEERPMRGESGVSGLAGAIYQGIEADEGRFRHGMGMLHRLHGSVHALSQPNSLSTYLADILARSIEPILSACYNVYKDSSVILLASGIALTVNYFGAPRYPILAASSDTTLAGSVALAKLVGTTFLFKSALEPFVWQIIHFKEDTSQPQMTKTIWHQRAVRYFNPLALALIVSYARGWNVKPLEGTLYSVGLFALMKLLGEGFDYVCRRQDIASAEGGEGELRSEQPVEAEPLLHAEGAPSEDHTEGQL